MPCNADKSILFIHIPKTGGTSIEKALDYFGPWEVENQKRLFGLIKSPVLLSYNWKSAFLQHLTFSEINQHWDFSSALVFSVVRNPWARFASIFNNIDTHLKDHAYDLGLKIDKFDFEQFIVATEGIEHVHLQNQISFLKNDKGELAINEILHTENLSAEFSKFSDNNKLLVKLPWLNKAKIKIISQ